MLYPASRQLWFVLAAMGASTGIISIFLSDWLHLDPCYLCIVERLLFLMLSATSLAAAICNRQICAQVLGLNTLLISIVGVGVSVYQSWLQTLPPGTITCVNGNPGFIEQVVEWLGALVPSLFLATGFCEDAGLILFGLSLANWAAIMFAACLAGSAWALWNNHRTV